MFVCVRAKTQAAMLVGKLEKERKAWTLTHSYTYTGAHVRTGHTHPSTRVLGPACIPYQ